MTAVENDPQRSAASDDLYLALAGVFIAALVFYAAVFYCRRRLRAGEELGVQFPA